jgi:hypothetical protein
VLRFVGGLWDVIAGRESLRDALAKFKPVQVGQMAGVPDFEIVSEPVEFDVVRPLDVRVRVKRSMKAGEPTRLSELLDVVLVNLSKEPIECKSPTLHAEGQIKLYIDAGSRIPRPEITMEDSTYGVQRVLNPGDALSLLGPDEFANGVDGTWICPDPGRIKLRAEYSAIPTTRSPTYYWTSSESGIRSAWFEVIVE